ncbi:MAG TPA: hypothetical protein VF041_20625 [Gemmatimonadaceae bacterium]
MTRRAKIWLVAGLGLFVGINFAGAIVAAVQGEPLHASAHVALLLLGVFVVWLLTAPSAAGRFWRRREPVPSPLHRELSDRLSNLEQSVDAVAIEVERIGEGQRFLSRLFSENGPPRASGEGDAAPIGRNAPSAAPGDRRD